MNDIYKTPAHILALIDDTVVYDPATGSGGMLLKAFDSLLKNPPFDEPADE